MPNRTTEEGSSEGFGLVFLEASACGKPVIGGRSGGVTDVIDHEETGLLVDCSDPANIADAILRMIDDRELYSHCVSRSVAHAESMSWYSTAQSFRRACLAA
jgi:phosphatidylinositol alpha-1,6-mannosyltransferase